MLPLVIRRSISVHDSTQQIEALLIARTQVILRNTLVTEHAEFVQDSSYAIDRMRATPVGPLVIVMTELIATFLYFRPDRFVWFADFARRMFSISEPDTQHIRIKRKDLLVGLQRKRQGNVVVSLKLSDNLH